MQGSRAAVADELQGKNTPDKSKRLAILLELRQFIRPYRMRTIAALFALVFTAALTLSVGQALRMMIDSGFAQHSSEQLQMAIMFIMIVTSMIGVGTYARFYLVSWLGERVSADIRMAVFNHVITLPPGYFETCGSGDIMSRITTDTTLLQTIIGSSFSMAMRSTLLLIGAVMMLFATNIKLTFVVLLAVPLILAPILYYGRKVRALSRKSQDSMSDVGSYAGEAIENIKTVQSYSREEEESELFFNEVERAFLIGRQRVQQRALLIAGVIVIVFGAITGMLWVGGSDVISGRMSGGDLGAFVFYSILVASSMATVSEVLGELQRAAGATERLVEVLQVRSNIQPPVDDVVSASELEAEVLFDQVTFSYPSRPDQSATEKLTLKAEKGKVLALVGPSGAGKTTVFELIQRFYDPQSGVIRLGGVDIKRTDPKDLRQMMALVPQQPALFSSDVMHNIRYGRPEATDEEVIEAAKKANAHEFIIDLPDGYYSFLGERGVRLSGGQRQRIAIARAILKDPHILLLDEATSALDSESEYKVQQALESLMHNRTTLIIAHRLSTIQHADKIAVLEEGSLVDLGDHNSLLESCELYRRLVELQFKNFQ
ncbi:ATP-binding cassette domain-containing protein [Vibrio sp. JC009]|uniref:ABC transporter transmembrane domain-containing protein n=1 Tax=Vibrio sp. JC009 TaxID=2912314 RepID=UPI0023AEF42F|nr:ABC transporter transmembrane domain-containing protein [Vibrio sp. JC009]WED24870.1 ATP-binding cassette domain-containing protein [Vibrio sp. JC009]